MILRHYFISTIRQLCKRKLYSFINAIGLSLAIGFFLLVYLFIKSDLSFDKFHTDRGRIFLIKSQVFSKQDFDAGNKNYYRSIASITNGLGEAIKSGISEAEEITLIKIGFGELTADRKIVRQTIHFVDSNFFKLFTFPVAHGQTYKLFVQPNELVICKTLAVSLFGNSDVVGRVIQLGHENEVRYDFIIKAVLDVPENSSIQFELLAPLQNYKPMQSPDWASRQYIAFVKLKDENTAPLFVANTNILLARKMDSWINQIRKENNLEQTEPVERIALTPMSEIHFDPTLTVFRTSDKMFSLILTGIALLIAVIASINYTLFAIGSSSLRRKEIGIRKAIGAMHNQINIQFNLEAIGLSVVSGCIGLILAATLLPLFNTLMEVHIVFSINDVLPLTGFLLISMFVLGILAGAYPAWYLSRINPIIAFKQGIYKVSTFHANALVVTQSALSAFVMISALILFYQMRHITTYNLGFNKEHVLTVPMHHDWGTESDLAIEKLRSEAVAKLNIDEVAGIVNAFGRGGSSTNYDFNDQDIVIELNRCDSHFIPMMGIELVAGRNFSESASDDYSIIINEALVHAFGWKDPLNQSLNFYNIRWQIIGVVRDYNFKSLEQKVSPLVLFGSPSSRRYLSTALVKLNGGNIPDGVSELENSWKALFPDKPFEFSFVEDDIARQYKTYERWSSIAGTSTILAFLIASLGLFGLAGIHSANKTKEIAIRKIMGADFNRIFYHLNRPYIAMALFAYVIATPLAWYVMSNWINKFAYQISFGWEIFIVSMLSGLVITLGTVSYHVIKIANSNPVESLKYE